MFEKWFAKYARAVSDEGERRSLYKKYAAKIIALIVFYVLCAAALVGMIALENYLNESWALYTVTALLCTWVISGIVALILWLSFKRAYREILNRPARSGEMPEVASYRQKRELESNPEYAKNLEWYNLNDNFHKFNGKIYFICLAVAIVLGWVLAILFPHDLWSLLAFVPIIIVVVINNKFVKDLRKKAIPIENEIDRQNALREKACADTDTGENAVDEFKADCRGEEK